MICHYIAGSDKHFSAEIFANVDNEVHASSGGSDHCSTTIVVDCATPPPSEQSSPPVTDKNSNSTAHSESNTVGAKAIYPTVCRNHEQFKAWQKTRSWLTFHSVSGSVKCLSCSHIKQLGLHAIPGQHIETAFDKYVKGKNAKVLLKKIDKHRDSAAHEMCETILAEREAERIQTAIKMQK